MITHYFKIAWRNLFRHKMYSVITVVGLATGISACLLIFLYVTHELTYEQAIPGSDQIYRVVTNVNFQGKAEQLALSPRPLSAQMQRQFPEIKHCARIAPIGKQTVWLGQQAYVEENIFYADSTFFQVMSFAFVAGDLATALREPNTMVLSEELAQKYYGTAGRAMGKVLTFSGSPFTVTGVYKAFPHSHLVASAFLSQVTRDLALKQETGGTGDPESRWLALGFYTYFTLHDPAALPLVQQKLAQLIQDDVEPWIRKYRFTATMQLKIQPIREIHLNNQYTHEISPSGNRSYVYIFTVVAVFLLLPASIT